MISWMDIILSSLFFFVFADTRLSSGHQASGVHGRPGPESTYSMNNPILFVHHELLSEYVEALVVYFRDAIGARSFVLPGAWPRRCLLGAAAYA